MRVGIFIPPWGEAAEPHGMAAVAETADELGFSSVWIGDHIVFPRSTESTYLYNESGVSPFDPDQPLYDPITLVAWLAGRTTQARLGLSVLVLPIRNPVETAKHLADVAALSGGRLAVGVGSGWMREEFEALGADYERRGAITDEWIAIFRHLWSGSDEAFAGEHYSFGSLGFQPSPGPLPVIVGGNSRRAMRRAAENDGWHAIRMPAEDVAEGVAHVNHLRTEQGHPNDGFEFVYRGTVAASSSPLDSSAAEVMTTLEDYAGAGVTEFILEWPDVTSARRIEWMSWLADHDVIARTRELRVR